MINGLHKDATVEIFHKLGHLCHNIFQLKLYIPEPGGQICKVNKCTLYSTHTKTNISYT